MKILKKIAKILIIIGATIYMLLCFALYFGQEKVLFHPTKLDKDYQFKFSGNFTEYFFTANDGTDLHGVLFNAESPKGLIFYCHGNSGSIARYVYEAEFYTKLGYDMFIFDYRGYGKSDSKITNEDVLHQDIQMAYDSIKQLYNEDSITIMGYSIGSGLSSNLARNNNPKQLILKAPYYSLKDMMKKYYPWAPLFLLRYHFNNNENITACSFPVTIFHGDKDQVIYHGSSLKLNELLSAKDTCITLKNQDHVKITKNPDYLKIIGTLLN